jgi:hypothetical protein
MLLIPRHGEELESLAYKIKLAEAPSCNLIHEVAAACSRFGVLKRTGKFASFEAWCRSGAWLDATLALVSGVLPAWSVRRIVKDDGFWICSLSRSPNLPIELDDCVEVTHESLPLAVLLALVEARQLGPSAVPARAAPATDVGEERHRMLSDNFA